MPGGRPVEYNDAILAKAKDYLINHESEGDLVPSIAGLADNLKKHRDTLYDWAKKYPEFSDTLDEIETKQHRKLLSGGLKGDMNATIVKLMLHNHGYSDKSDNTHSGPGGGPLEHIVDVQLTAPGFDDQTSSDPA